MTKTLCHAVRKCSHSHPSSSVAIGKRITPRETTRTLPGNHHYCFVDFSSAQEAERAMAALNGKPVEGGSLRVSLPRSKGPAFDRAGTNHGWGNGTRSSDGSRERGGRPGRQQDGRREGQQEGQEGGQDGQQDRRERVERQRAIMASSNWRMGGGAN